MSDVKEHVDLVMNQKYKHGNMEKLIHQGEDNLIMTSTESRYATSLKGAVISKTGDWSWILYSCALWHIINLISSRIEPHERNSVCIIVRVNFIMWNRLIFERLSDPWHHSSTSLKVFFVSLLNVNPLWLCQKGKYTLTCYSVLLFPIASDCRLDSYWLQVMELFPALCIFFCWDPHRDIDSIIW